MELGNMIFGCSRGQYGIPRDAGYEYELTRLFDATGVDRDSSGREYGVDFENHTFSTFPYYWGDCTCGYEQREQEWSDANEHQPECYQVRLRSARIEAGWAENQWGFLDPPKGSPPIFECPVQKRLCVEMDLEYPCGAAVHCTCDHEDRWRAWRDVNDHDPKCPIVRPNFWHKPSDYRLMWYKYPLRDSYANQDLTVDEFSKVIDDCISSLS